MRVAFRCDSDSTVGAGHAIRSLTLGLEFASAGHEVTYVGNISIPWVHDEFNSQGSNVLSATNNGQALSTIAQLKPDLVVLDSYLYSQTEKSKLAEVSNLVEIVDLQPSESTNWIQVFPYPCQPLQLNRVIAGEDYMIIRDLLVQRDHHAARDPNMPRILILTGGFPRPELQTSMFRVLKATQQRFEVVLVRGDAVQDEDFIARELGPEVLVSSIPPTNDIVRILSSVDAVFTTAGTSVWEILLAGLPCLLFAGFQNQSIVATVCEEQGWADVLNVNSNAGLETTENIEKVRGFITGISAKVSTAPTRFPKPRNGGANRLMRSLNLALEEGAWTC